MGNIGSYIIGILGIVILMLGWVLVQSWWRRTFSDDLSYDNGDEDVLAGRTDCGNCGCTTVCKNGKKNNGSGSSSRLGGFEDAELRQGVVSTGEAGVTQKLDSRLF